MTYSAALLDEVAALLPPTSGVAPKAIHERLGRGSLNTVRAALTILRRAGRAVRIAEGTYCAPGATTDLPEVWTDERVENLKQWWGEGASASEIAKRLDCGASRNAVIGKVHRLGLMRPKHKHGKPPPRPDTRREPQRQTPPPVRDEELPKPARVPPPDPPTSAAMPIEFMQQRDHLCKWPIGDPRKFSELRFCGRPAPGTGPYCAEHTQLSVQPRRAA